jgi:hypothetical protein
MNLDQVQGFKARSWFWAILIPAFSREEGNGSAGGLGVWVNGVGGCGHASWLAKRSGGKSKNQSAKFKEPAKNDPPNMPPLRGFLVLWGAVPQIGRAYGAAKPWPVFPPARSNSRI